MPATYAAVVPEHMSEKFLDELVDPIFIAERVRKSVTESVSFISECSEIDKQVEQISQLLRSIVRLSTSHLIYDRPIRYVTADVARKLIRALSLIRKCRHRSFACQLLNRVTASEFRKVFGILDASVADLRWLIAVVSCSDGGGLPPIAGNDPVLAWVWSFTATVQMSGRLPDRVEAANALAALARDSDRNKKMIVEEGGIPPFLKLLMECNSQEAQIASAIALYDLCNVEERVNVIVDCLGIGVIVKVLSDSNMKVQIRVSNLVARMSELSNVAKEVFVRENVISPLVSLLSFETFDDDNSNIVEFRKHSIPSLVRIKKEIEEERKDLSLKTRVLSSYSSLSMRNYDEGSSRGGMQKRKEREMESSEVKRELKVSCAKALWILAKDSVSNSRRITETKGLLCLAKLVEKEDGELRFNCLMTIKEITLAAELNPDLRWSAFKTNSPAAKAVVDQLLRLIKKTNDPTLQIPAIISIGSLNRTFPAKDDPRVISPLVDQLSSKDHEVGTEAAIALGKFVDLDNYLRLEHAKSIIEFNGVIPLMRLLREGERAQIHGLTLLCHLAILVGDSEAIEQARVLTALEGAERTAAAQHPQVQKSITLAIQNLYLYRDVHQPRQFSLRIYD